MRESFSSSRPQTSPSGLVYHNRGDLRAPQQHGREVHIFQHAPTPSPRRQSSLSPTLLRRSVAAFSDAVHRASATPADWPTADRHTAGGICSSIYRSWPPRSFQNSWRRWMIILCPWGAGKQCLLQLPILQQDAREATHLALRSGHGRQRGADQFWAHNIKLPRKGPALRLTVARTSGEVIRWVTASPARATSPPSSSIPGHASVGAIGSTDSEPGSV